MYVYIVPIDLTRISPESNSASSTSHGKAEYRQQFFIRGGGVWVKKNNPFRHNCLEDEHQVI